MTRPVLTGQAPGPNTDPDHPLYPVPWSSAPGRLCRLMGIGADEYLELFDRANVLYRFPRRHKRDDKFPARDARVAAEAMRPLLRGRRAVFVGRSVAEAFGYPGHILAFHTWQRDPKWEIEMAVVPHTSGRSHWYNHEPNRREAETFWADTLEKVRPMTRRVLSSVVGGRI